jgi:hypothetical protein
VRPRVEPLEVLLVPHPPDPAHEAAVRRQREVELDGAVLGDRVGGRTDPGAHAQARPAEVLLQGVLLRLEAPALGVEGDRLPHGTIVGCCGSAPDYES